MTTIPLLKIAVPQEVLKGVQDYWKELGITINFNFKTVTVPDNYHYTVNMKNSATVYSSLLGLKLSTLNNIYDDVVWFNTSISGSNDSENSKTLGVGDSGTSMIVTNYALPHYYNIEDTITTVNHELGHVFKLGHTNDKDNLMNPKLENITDTLLTDDQLETIREHINNEL